MKTILFGGTFNPVHLGHLHVLHSIAFHTDYERVIILPASQPPHKAYRQVITDSQRLELLHLAVEDYHRLYPDDRALECIIDTCEIDRGGKSYMYDSVMDIHTRYEITGTLALAIGDDLFPTLKDWYRGEDLIQLVHFVVITRDRQNENRVFPNQLDGEFLEVAPVRCSSTSIRDQLKSTTGCLYSLKEQLSESVLDYIIDYGLYKND